MATRTPGIIRADDVLTLREFLARAGLGDFSYRQARADGLRVVRIGRKIFVRGLDWHEFINRAAERQAQTQEAP